MSRTIGPLIVVVVLAAACSGSTGDSAEETTIARGEPTPGVSTEASTTMATTATVPTTATTQRPTPTTTEPPTTTTTTAMPVVPPNDPMSVAVVSVAELRDMHAEAVAFADRTQEAWPDIDEHFGEFADEATFYDPSDGDFLVEGRANIIAIHRVMGIVFPDREWETTGLFLSADGAAYHVTWFDLWPPWVPEPAEHPPLEGLELYRFEDDLVTSNEIWFPSKGVGIEFADAGCFADGCLAELLTIADRYLAAWQSRNAGRVAGLYDDHAVFTDSLLGLEAEGADAIGDLADKRFGSVGDITLDVILPYYQTYDTGPPTEEEPEAGRIIGVGIHYRLTASIDGDVTTVDSLTTFDIDPQGAITREEVFHDSDSLMATASAP